MSLIEALRGSSSNNLFEAIFDVELDETDYGLFLDESDREADIATLHSFHSRANSRVRNEGKRRLPLTQTKHPSSPGSSSIHAGERSGEPGSSNIVFPVDLISVSEVPTPSITESPLTKLFRSRFLSTPGIVQPTASSEPAVAVAQVAARAAMNIETSARHIETLLEAVSELPVQKLKGEMKELQVRLFVGFGVVPLISSFPS